MNEPTTSELASRLRAANDRIAELETARVACRDAVRRHAGARQDAEPAGHLRDDPRPAAAGRALRQLVRAGDPGRPPGDRGRPRLRRPGGAARGRLRPRRRDQPEHPGPPVEAAARHRRRVAPPALREPAARRRPHSRLDLRAADLRRPRHRRPHARQVRARLLRRRARRARHGLCRPGRDRDRECTAARDRARRPRAGRDAACGGRSRSAAR